MQWICISGHTGSLLWSIIYLGSVLFFIERELIPRSNYFYAKFFTLFHCKMEYLLGDETLGIYYYRLFQRLKL